MIISLSSWLHNILCTGSWILIQFSRLHNWDKTKNKKGHSSRKTENSWHWSNTFLSHNISWTSGWILTKFSWTHNSYITKNWLEYDYLDLIFKVTAVENWKFVTLAWHFLVCTISCEPVVGFLPNFLGYIFGTQQRTDKILVTLT